MPVTLWSQPVPAENEWVVVIDAGHGGKDPGAVGSKAREKNINLAVALKTGAYIKNNMKDVKVIYTRDDDTFIGLAERAEVANRHKADLFISIHSNAMSDTRFSGAETYVLGQTMDEANLQVAMKENSVITFEKDYETKYEGFDPNSVESYIIFSLMQNTYLKQSTEFATLIQNQFRRGLAGRTGASGRQGSRCCGGRQCLRCSSSWVSSLIPRRRSSSCRNRDRITSHQPFTGHSEITGRQLTAGRGSSPVITHGCRKSRRSGLTPPSRLVPESSGSQATEVKGTVAAPAESEPVTVAAAPQSASEVPFNPPVIEKEAPTASAADDIFFMVQIAAMPRDREMDKNQLKSIETVTKIEEGDRVKYAAGKFPVYDDAIKYRRTLVLGFPDAFVIAVRNGKTMPLAEAINAKKQK
ncbi:MAG: N-acetylmuramoyl-L-alanine amidase [Marinilabiliales bacterium]|nr:N-acetylmuramoyl-L-alanine amidase [Marinilabiliales bacterium]